MQIRLAILCAVTALVTSVAPLRAATVEKLKNDKVRVVETTLAPGQSESISGDRPSILVYMEGTAAELGFVGAESSKVTVHRGETVAQPATLNKITNAGSTPLHLVRTEFLTSGSSETWGMTGLPPNYKMIVENRFSRTYDIRIPAHGREPQHTHHARIVICLSGAKLEHILADGQHQPSTLATGEIAWRPGATHIGHNLGDTNLWVIAIEPK